MKIFSIILLVFGIFVAANSARAAGACTGIKLAGSQKNIRAYLKNLDKDNTPWISMKNAFKDFRDCMSIAETYDFGEAIRTTFNTKWTAISDLSRIKKEDEKFYHFVMTGIEDETANFDEIKSILKKAKFECPKNQTTVCDDIVKFAGPLSK